ncbi:MAG: dynamin family protein [Acidobacteriota bacterium]
MSEDSITPRDREAARRALEAVGEICERRGIAALRPFLTSCRNFEEEEVLNIAVLGRFKAGKSTFLNCLFGRPLLPVGAVPVTTAVTEIQYGRRERAEVHFSDGHTEEISLERIEDFIAERRNPGNFKNVRAVRIELPSLERFRRVRFVDTPGLESVLKHNTEAALDWLPNVGLALVAVGVDPPLSRHDIELIRQLGRYTSDIALILTKVDLLDAGELLHVQDFIRQQLARFWSGAIPVFPYSSKPGFEEIRALLDSNLLSRVSSNVEQHRTDILGHKIASLLSECADYLNLALKSAEIAESQRAALQEKLLGDSRSLEDTRLALRLIARHLTGNARSTFKKVLADDELPLRRRLLDTLDRDFPSWAASLSSATKRFEEWLRSQIGRDMSELSSEHRDEFLEPVREAGRRMSQSLQDFRNRLSERTLETLGVALRTTEMEPAIREPHAPDVRVPYIFDHHWELLSFLLPMSIIGRWVERHFERTVQDVVYMNLSRLTTQWEEIVSAAILSLEREARERLDALVGTVEKLVNSTSDEVPQLREDLRRLHELRAEFSVPEDQHPHR